MKLFDDLVVRASRQRAANGLLTTSWLAAVGQICGTSVQSAIVEEHRSVVNDLLEPASVAGFVAAGIGGAAGGAAGAAAGRLAAAALDGYLAKNKRKRRETDSSDDSRNQEHRPTPERPSLTALLPWLAAPFGMAGGARAGFGIATALKARADEEGLATFETKLSSARRIVEELEAVDPSGQTSARAIDAVLAELTSD